MTTTAARGLNAVVAKSQNAIMEIHIQYTSPKSPSSYAPIPLNPTTLLPEKLQITPYETLPNPLKIISLFPSLAGCADSTTRSATSGSSSPVTTCRQGRRTVLTNLHVMFLSCSMEGLGWLFALGAFRVQLLGF